MLIVGDGRALTFIDYDVGQRQRWPINDSPLSVLLNPDQDLARFAHVVQNDAQVLMIEARDARPPRVRHDHHRLRQGRRGAGRAGPAGLEHPRCPEQPHHRSTVQPALQRAGRGRRVPLPRADPAARPARLKKATIRSSARQVGEPSLEAAIAGPGLGFPPVAQPDRAIDLA
jgi:hypothetical protein